MANLRLSPTGSYLVTGGFGGLGLLVAKFLVENGVKNLILTGRRGAPASAADALAELESMGANVVSAKADVANEADMARVFNDAKAAGTPVRGVMHSAGILDDKNLAIKIPRPNFRSPKGPFVPGNTPVWTFSRHGRILG